VGQHREIIGGMWEELGRLQFEFLLSQGLRPEHRVLDVGAGSLRLGVKLAAFLEPGGYWAVDKNTALLDAGWMLELGPLGLQARQPRDQLVTLDDFQFDRLGQTFDYAIAQSLFTHLSWHRIRRCLARLAPAINERGRLFATFFEIPAGSDRETAATHMPGGVETYSDRDPYHYSVADLRQAAGGLPWQVELLGEWGHPRDQRMVVFTRQAEEDKPARTLQPGEAG
jgi:hypothetical protein